MAKVIYSSNLWFNDIDKIINSLPELETLSGKSIIITGAGGLICSSVVDILIRYNETHNNKINILAAGRNINKIRERFKDFSGRDYFTYINYDTSRINYIPPEINYIIHGASNAYPAIYSLEPVETMTANITGIKLPLDYARENNSGKVLYISSSEVYGQRADNNTQAFRENDYGYTDLLNMRNCYAVSKRAAETLLAGYKSEFGVNSLIVRPGHIYGPTASERDNRVGSAFPYLAARGENIIMKSDGLQLRSWCYCLDCAGAILKVLLNGESVQAYNIPGTILTIREIAEMLASFGNVKLIRENASDSEKRVFNSMNNSSLDGSKLEALGWKNLFDAQTGFKHTVEILKARI